MSRIRSDYDAELVKRTLAVREHLGVGEDVRVEDLSAMEFLELQADQALARLMEADAAQEAAEKQRQQAFEYWLAASTALANAKNQGIKESEMTSKVPSRLTRQLEDQQTLAWEADCRRCFSERGGFLNVRMFLCPTCGNKRCPKATDHRLTCTGSNEPGQEGSDYA